MRAVHNHSNNCCPLKVWEPLFTQKEKSHLGIAVDYTQLGQKAVSGGERSTGWFLAEAVLSPRCVSGSGELLEHSHDNAAVFLKNKAQAGKEVGVFPLGNEEKAASGRQVNHGDQSLGQATRCQVTNEAAELVLRLVYGEEILNALWNPWSVKGAAQGSSSVLVAQIMSSASRQAPKRQRLDQIPQDVAARTRVVYFHRPISFGLHPSDILEDRYGVFAVFMQNLEDQFDQASQRGFWANRDILVSNANLLHFFIYDLWRPGDVSKDRPPVEDRGELDPIFKLLDWDCAEPLRLMGGDSSALLLGWALVEPWPEERVHRLHFFDTFFPDCNFESVFYQQLSQKFASLIVFEPAPASLAMLKHIGALHQTLDIWAGRDPHEIGFGVPDTLCATRDIDKATLDSLVVALSREAASHRNRLMTLLNLAFECDGPILEAISGTWPEPVKVGWLRRFEGGLQFLHDRHSTGTNKQMRFDLRHHIDPDGPGDQMIFRTNELHRVSFGPNTKAAWGRHSASWPAIFAEFGLRLNGSSFGHFLGLDQPL